jgi:hypothetical protein
VTEAGGAVTDASFCQESLGAWCATAQWPTCTGDWASALRNPPGGQGCSSWSTAFCGGYHVLSQQGIDSGQYYFYDPQTGQLVAIVSTGNVEVCLGGPADFTFPSVCSQGMSACDQGGADSGTE